MVRRGWFASKNQKVIVYKCHIRAYQRRGEIWRAEIKSKTLCVEKKTYSSTLTVDVNIDRSYATKLSAVPFLLECHLHGVVVPCLRFVCNAKIVTDVMVRKVVEIYMGHILFIQNWLRIVGNCVRLIEALSICYHNCNPKFKFIFF